MNNDEPISSKDRLEMLLNELKWYREAFIGDSMGEGGSTLATTIDGVEQFINDDWRRKPDRLPKGCTGE